MEEDSLLENLTAVLFLTAAIALFAAAREERRVFLRCAYILGGAAMAFFAGEEISWGQRIIGFETPAFLVDLNAQKEFNIHNIYKVDAAVFDRPIVNGASYLLALAGCAAFFCRKERTLGIPTPPILLTLALLIAIAYIDHPVAWTFHAPWDQILFWRRGLFLLLLIFALLSRNAMLLIATAASWAFTLAIAYVYLRNGVLSYRNYQEPFEYLFGLIAIFYALTALPYQGAARRMITEVVAGLTPAAALPSKRIPTTTLDKQKGTFFNKVKRGYPTPWTTFCAVMVVGSVGLALLAQFNYRADVAAFKEAHMLAETAEPMARSNFDVYIDGRELHYLKQPCDETDVKDTFFLGVFPKNVLDLAVDRRQAGFDNLDFDFYAAQEAMILDDACAAMVKLPAYDIAGFDELRAVCPECEDMAKLPAHDIARISTGQYIVETTGTTTNLWIAEFPVGDK